MHYRSLSVEPAGTESDTTHKSYYNISSSAVKREGGHRVGISRGYLNTGLDGWAENGKMTGMLEFAVWYWS